jgi:histidinol-phosphatase (PHP family)
MEYKNLVDFHVHTDNSDDAHDSLMVISERAVSKKIRALAVTDHAECQRYFRDGFHRAIRHSFFEALKAKSAFYGQLAIMAGIELGQPLHNLEAANDALNANFYDFVIASLHCVRGEKDFWKVDYCNANVPSLLHTYFDEIYEMVCWGQFDTLAHLTYPLRYIVGREKIPVDLKDYEAQINLILERLIADGKALELNTQGFRTEYGRPTPDLDILKRFKEMGGKYVTIGSDCHYAADVGANISDGYDLLKEAGFEYVTIYDKREPLLVPIQ